MEGRIFDIQRFSTHDGPGIRTTVFFKGCNLRCGWCHNPESIAPHAEIQRFPAKCIGCGACVRACPAGAFVPGEYGTVWDRSKCEGCGRCAEVCFAGARRLSAHTISVDSAVREVLADKVFYKENGGMTASGGEPLLQADFLAALLSRLRAEGVHTAIDTAGNVPWARFEQVLAHTNLFLYDIKAADAARHRAGTGVTNDLILANFDRLCDTGARIWVRIPCIPGFNADDASMEALAALLAPYAQCLDKVELLSFHKLGGGKYESMDQAYTYKDTDAIPKERMERWRGLFSARGLKAAYS